jgi:hypothetical protein
MISIVRGLVKYGGSAGLHDMANILAGREVRALRICGGSNEMRGFLDFALCASLGMTLFCGLMETCGGSTHLSDDETVAKMGHPICD